MPRILGVDFGDKRVGLAVSDPDGVVALAVRIASVSGMKEAVEAVVEACHEHDADRIVVGEPVNMDGTRGMMAERVAAFVAMLNERATVPVDTWDERLSTGLVERAMLEADLSRKKRKGARDKLAAQVILQGYLDAHQAAAEPPDDDWMAGDEW